MRLFNGEIAQYEKLGELWLWDFDAYDHRALGMTYEDVINNPTKKCGHAFILAMMLENRRVWSTKTENGV